MNRGAPASEADGDERCQYPNKLCKLRRTTKRDGGLHRFCAVHRDKANRNQKRWLESRQHKLHKTRRLNSVKSELPAADQSLLPSSSLDVDLDHLETDFELLFGANLAALENADVFFADSQDLSLLDDDTLFDFIDQFLNAETDSTLHV